MRTELHARRLVWAASAIALLTGMSGVVAQSGAHVHASIADETGKTSGGHLLEGNLVYTTLEVVLLEYPHLEFTRELDRESGYNELVIKPLVY